MGLNKIVPDNTVVINCKNLEDVELMFWQNVNAYAWCPSEKEITDLLNKGYKIEAFKSHPDFPLPGYVLNESRIKISVFYSVAINL